MAVDIIKLNIYDFLLLMTSCAEDPYANTPLKALAPAPSEVCNEGDTTTVGARTKLYVGSWDPGCITCYVPYMPLGFPIVS